MEGLYANYFGQLFSLECLILLFIWHILTVWCLQLFERVLYIWAIRHPASGYVQGLNDLITPLFVVFLSEYIEPGWCS